jgi:hypothetical protein
MAIPTKKIYGRNGKVIFDPSNPEDVKNYREKEPLLEAFKLVQGLTDPRTGGGLTGATRIISKAINAKMAKSKFTQNKAKQLADLVTKPMTKGKKAVTKKATPTVKEVVETKPTIPTTVPTTMELAQIPGTSVKTIKEGIKSFTGKTEKFVPKTNRLITRANSSAGNLKPFKGSATRPGSTPMNYTPTDPSKALSSIKEVSKIVSKMPKEKLDNFSKILLGTAGLGIASGISYQGYKSYQGLTSKPMDLNNIKEADLIDSTKYKDVKIIKTSTGDKGIIKDPKTGKWKYFNEKEGVLLKNKVGLGDGPPIGLDNNNQNKGNNQGSNKSGNTTPRSATGQSFDKAFAEARKQAGGAGGIFEWNGKKYGTALKGEAVPKDRVEVGKTTTPVSSTYVGDEYYKKDPSLETLRQQDDDRQLLARAEAQKKEMMEFEPTELLPTKPLSSLVFKTTNTRDEQAALKSIREDNKLPLKKKRYGGNLAMLKYMK